MQYMLLDSFEPYLEAHSGLLLYTTLIRNVLKLTGKVQDDIQWYTYVASVGITLLSFNYILLDLHYQKFLERDLNEVPVIAHGKYNV